VPRVVDTPPAGHILWGLRTGTGQGSLHEKGLRLKVSVEGEATGTYRIYDYIRVSDDEYDMKSVQYDARGKATGLFYGGTFVRATMHAS
jgi:hypothetical protein